MKYRKHPRSGEEISILGFGCGYLREINPSLIKEIFEYGLNQGMNFIDCIRVEDKFIKPIRESIKEFTNVNNNKIYTQMHLTGEFIDGEYKRPREVKHMVDVLNDDLKAYGVDYCDFGLIHSVDEEKDYELIIDNGILDYAIKLKNEGLINHIGVSSHNPKVCSKFIQYGEIDFFMMSINPSFDYILEDGKLKINKERLDFYKNCKKNNIGISVMKPYGGGRLLNKDLSPLNYEFSTNQCLKYSLDRPGVLTTLPGFKSLEELKISLDFLNSNKEQCDYSFIGNLGENIDNQCVYCGHCQPCPNEIPIALISKLYDLSLIGDELAKTHYLNLEHKADECLKCMKCENYCMFGVNIVDKLENASKYYSQF